MKPKNEIMLMILIVVALIVILLMIFRKEATGQQPSCTCGVQHDAKGNYLLSGPVTIASAPIFTLNIPGTKCSPTISGGNSKPLASPQCCPGSSYSVVSGQNNLWVCQADVSGQGVWRPVIVAPVEAP